MGQQVGQEPIPEQSAFQEWIAENLVWGGTSWGSPGWIPGVPNYAVALIGSVLVLGLLLRRK